MKRHRHWKRRQWKTAAASVLALSLVAVACGDDDEDAAPVTEAPADDGTAAPTAPSTRRHRSARRTEAPDATEAPEATTRPICDTPTPVKLQLQWFVQAQFAGYFAAVDQEFYGDDCLDVEILEGGVDIVPQQQLADGAADFAIAWVPKALQTREAGADIVNIAQIFQRSGTLQVSFVDAGITSPDDFAGKKIGNWGFGNEYEIFAALTEAGLDPGIRRRARAAAVRHARPAGGRHRCRRGDDLQRVRPGAGGREPRHR